MLNEITEGQARALLSKPEEERREILEQAKKEGKLPSMREIHGYTHCESCGVGTFSGKECFARNIRTDGPVRKTIFPPAGEKSSNAVQRKVHEGIIPFAKARRIVQLIRTKDELGTVVPNSNNTYELVERLAEEIEKETLTGKKGLKGSSNKLLHV